MNYQQWLQRAEQRLQQNLASDPYLNAKFDVNLLLQRVSGKSKAALFAFAETELNEAELLQLERLLARRLEGEPMAYILGEQEFWSLPLSVSPATLIPRADTERLVEVAMQEAEKRLKIQATLQILDLGSGSGAIALALASELKSRAEIIGVDRIAEAVRLAQHNAAKLGITNVHFLKSDWFSQLQGRKFDMIVSNPPYIDAQDENLQFGDVRFEPRSALVADDHGFSDLQKIIENAPLALHPNGVLLLEHGWQQAQSLQRLLAQAGWQQIDTFQDYGGRDRVTKAEWQNE